MKDFRNVQAWCWMAMGLGLLTGVGFAGCGGPTLCQVQGKIVYSDGAPANDLEGYTITFDSVDQAATSEKPGVSASGVVQADGSFRVGTYQPGDGAVPGRHRVAITPPVSLADGATPPPRIPLKYASFQTSGLEVELKPGLNPVTLTVERNPAEKAPGGKK
ncbi:MAG: hypothetical protein NZ602_09075 [Thermoguttaceae bacterium]|nr:hypothetical protein [Thermoguttaceae bacterium]MDW8038301.1 hypothetical protein [Thermoguttaceae bacterium]